MKFPPNAGKTAATMGICHAVMLLLPVWGLGQTLKNLEHPAWLPDGTEFKSWEVKPTFTRTYYVDQRHPRADDANPGTNLLPFLTINQAAQVLQPGERVIIGAGIYRERIRPRRGGTGPDKMIRYEARQGDQVVVSGSRTWEGSWIATRVEGPYAAQAIWQTKLDPNYFGDYNPFALPNVTETQFAVMHWAASERGKAPYSFVRGLVFQDGRRLSQVATATALAGQAGTYWVDTKSQLLFARFFDDVKPQPGTIAITTEETLFAPDEIGLGYIQLTGLTFEHAAGPWPFEQIGAISTSRGHHWIIEDCTVRQVNGAGIDVGGQHIRWPQPPVIGFHIVRRNRVTDCGITGICGLGPAGGREFGLLIEDNVILRTAWHAAEDLWETGAIKTHRNVRCLIRHNLIVDTYNGPGIWMDYDNRATRCTGNVVLRTKSKHGAIFLEISKQPNLVDHNVVWDTRGSGIYEHDSTGQTFAHNLVGNSTEAAFHLRGRATDRRIDNDTMNYGSHHVSNNLLLQNLKPDIVQGQPGTWEGNVGAGLAASLDYRKLQLTLVVKHPLAECEILPGIDTDFYEKKRMRAKTNAGPFDRIPRHSIQLRLWRKPVPELNLDSLPGLLHPQVLN